MSTLKAITVGVFALLLVSSAAAQTPAQERRNLQVVRSIYETGKYGAGAWGARIAVAECHEATDEQATVEAFRQFIRDAYGKHYSRYQDSIEAYLAQPEIEDRFDQGYTFARHRLKIADQCSELVLGQVIEESRRALENQDRSMRRMASTLSPE